MCMTLHLSTLYFICPFIGQSAHVFRYFPSCSLCLPALKILLYCFIFSFPPPDYLGLCWLERGPALSPVDPAWKSSLKDPGWRNDIQALPAHRLGPRFSWRSKSISGQGYHRRKEIILDNMELGSKGSHKIIRNIDEGSSRRHKVPCRSCLQPLLLSCTGSFVVFVVLFFFLKLL